MTAEDTDEQDIPRPRAWSWVLAAGAAVNCVGQWFGAVADLFETLAEMTASHATFGWRRQDMIDDTLRDIERIDG